MNSVFEDVQKVFGQAPCCVVNCAGITRESLLLKMDEKDFDLVMQVNLKVSFSIILIQMPLFKNSSF